MLRSSRFLDGRPLRRRVTPAAVGLGALLVMLAGLADADAPQEEEESCNQAIPGDVLAAAAETTVGEASADQSLATAAAAESGPPDQFLPEGRRCRWERGRLVCDGPRRVPVSRGEAAALAQRLGLGTREAANRMLTGPPLPTWVEAVSGQASDRLAWPVPGGRLWRGYGYVRARRRARAHRGIDVGAPEGTEIVAVEDGLVAYSDNGVHGYGNLAMVVHADASVAYYAHCSELWVFAGQQVARGEVIGRVGHTGLARGDHLHFELRIGGVARNPLPRFERVPEPASK